MTEAGADIVVAHLGLTTGGSIGSADKTTLDDCVPRVAAIVEACKKLRKDVFVLCHGGPIATPADARYLFKHVRGLDGFYGASSMERLPTEIAIIKQVKTFKQLRLTPGKK